MTTTPTTDQTAPVLAFLELIDGDSDKGSVGGFALGRWPEIDVRREYFTSLPTANNVDDAFAGLYRAYLDDTLVRYSERSKVAGQIDWSRSWYDLTDQLGFVWGERFAQPCHHGRSEAEIHWGDRYGCLTACCGSAWSVNDGPPYCKCCFAEIDSSADRHEIYQLWEAPDLAHYAERIARLL